MNRNQLVLVWARCTARTGFIVAHKIAAFLLSWLMQAGSPLARMPRMELLAFVQTGDMRVCATPTLDYSCDGRVLHRKKLHDAVLCSQAMFKCTAQHAKHSSELRTLVEQTLHVGTRLATPNAAPTGSKSTMAVGAAFNMMRSSCHASCLRTTEAILKHMTIMQSLCDVSGDVS